MSIILLVGSSGAGKTWACLQIIQLATAQGKRVSGVVSLPSYTDQVKTEIILRDIGSGKERTLARVAEAGIEPDIGIWSFDPQTIAWGQDILMHTPVSDLLVIDEIGPLEISLGKGLINALLALNRLNYQIAVVSLRPLLIEPLLKLLPDKYFYMFLLNSSTRDSIPHSVLFELNKFKWTDKTVVIKQ